MQLNSKTSIKMFIYLYCKKCAFIYVKKIIIDRVI